MRMTGGVAAGLVVVLGLAGCAGGSSGGSAGGPSEGAALSAAASPTGSPPSMSAGPVTPSASTPPLVVITDDGSNGTFTAGPGGLPTGTGPVSAEPRGADPIPVLRSIRAAAQPGFDRVVLEFDGPVPGYRAEYVPQLVQDATGEPVPAAGRAFLRIAVQTATADDAASGGSRVYRGPARLAPRLGQVREVVLAGDFEGVLTVGLGLAARRGYRVTALAGPSRLVIDLATR